MPSWPTWRLLILFAAATATVIIGPWWLALVWLIAFAAELIVWNRGRRA